MFATQQKFRWTEGPSGKPYRGVFGMSLVCILCVVVLSACSEKKKRGKVGAPRTIPPTASQSHESGPEQIDSQENVTGNPVEDVAASSLPNSAAPHVFTPPADLYGDVELSWTTPFGPGRAVVPQLGGSLAPVSLAFGKESAAVGPEWFSRLTAVVFPPDGNEVVFVGVFDKDLPRLDPRELLDAFVVALRSVVSGGQAPGVTIEPLPEQLARGLREDDLMEVRYFGDSDETGMGHVAFEADRLMKCLSLGKDNISKAAFDPGVEGHKNELDLQGNAEQHRSQSWHRFWIEPAFANVGQSTDGRAFRVDVSLAVLTKYMIIRNGRLEDDKNHLPEPSAKKFADQLTQRYDDYAKKLPIFAKLSALAALTSVAEALRPSPTSDSDKQRPRPTIDLRPLLDAHQVTAVKTVVSTPATIMLREETIVAKQGKGKREVKHIRQLTGGVTLKPKNRHKLKDLQTDDLARDVLAARPPNRDTWKANSQGAEYLACAVRPRREQQLQQEDLRAGPLVFERDYVATGPAEEFGTGWRLRRPVLHISRKMADFELLGRIPESVRIEFRPGDSIVLGRAGRVSLPDAQGVNREAPAYLSADGSARLVLYSNVWIYLEGEVQFRSLNDGPFVPVLQPGARMLRFSAKDDHLVESFQDAQRSLTFTSDGNRLVQVADEVGHWIKLRYDDHGHCSAASSSDGGSVRYRYDAGGRLRSLFNEGNQRVTYSYGDMSGRVVAVGGNVSPAADLPTTAQFAIHADPQPSEGARLGDSATIVARLERQNNDKPAYVLKFGEETIDLDLNLVVEGMLNGDESDRATATLLIKEQILNRAVAGRKNLVIAGSILDKQNYLALALRQVSRNSTLELSISTAVDTDRAVKNLKDGQFIGGKASVYVLDDKLDSDVKTKIKERVDESRDSNVVIVIGDSNDVNYKKLLEQHANGQLAGKHVVVIACATTKQPADLILPLLGDSYRARSVTSFAQPISQWLLPALLEGMQSRLKAQTGRSMRPADILQLLDETVRDIQQLPPKSFHPSVDEKDVNVLLFRHQQLGRRGLNRSPFRSESAQVCRA